MMDCINCGKENEGRSKYCDNTCKTQYHRNVSPETVSKTDEVKRVDILLSPGDKLTLKAIKCINNPVHIWNPVKDMGRIDLEQKIRAYPNDQWINSPEHKELMSRLHSMTVEELEADGYWIPAWKRAA